ncbi:MAG: poly(R)-hydroxyalkanoic acid synthase subunit PhaE [Gammaproteobacteria bacterium]|nr:poly(R)-hydroxyalkanoic acid synthase subunit PhaE [Gammaproteobacteria bacterium]
MNALMKLWTEAQKSLFQSAAAANSAKQARTGDAAGSAAKGAKLPWESAMSLQADLSRAWLESSKKFLEGFSSGMKPQSGPGTTQSSDTSASEQPATAALAGMQEFWRSTQSLWRDLARTGWKMEQPGEAVAEQTFFKLLDPATWLNAGSDQFDLGVQRISEGPTFATLWELDRKLARLAEARAELERASIHYHGLMMGCWSRSYEKFLNQQLSREPGDQPEGWRDLLNRWNDIANAELISMHRSEDFLGAQRSLIRLAMEYRLREREIAEAYCEANHIPTRTEVDELQEAVYVLRRELRELRSRSKAATADTAESAGKAPRSDKPKEEKEA